MKQLYECDVIFRSKSMPTEISKSAENPIIILLAEQNDRVYD